MDDRSHEVLAVCVFFFVLSWITVALRTYVRACMLKSFGSDDWLMVITLFFFTCYLGCQLGGLRYGTGRHHRDLPKDSVEKALKYWYFCELFYILASSWLKIAIGVFLLRVAVRRPHVWTLRLFMAGTAIFGTIYFFVVLLQCRPISGFWVQPHDSHICVDPRIIVNATYAASAINAVADWTFGVLPIFIVWNLNMTRKAKALVAGILAFAAVGSTATLIRLPYLHTLLDTDDFLYATTSVAIWSTVEPGIGISAGCIATLRPLLQSLLFKAGLASYGPGTLGRKGNTPMPHSGDRGKGGMGRTRSRVSRQLGLDNLRLGGTTTTTVTAMGAGDNGSEEEILGHGIRMKVEVRCEEIETDKREFDSESVRGLNRTNDMV